MGVEARIYQYDKKAKVRTFCIHTFKHTNNNQLKPIIAPIPSSVQKWNSIDLEDCLDLAIRKGKAVRETKPTETQMAIFRLSVSGPVSPDFPVPFCFLGPSVHRFSPRRCFGEPFPLVPLSRVVPRAHTPACFTPNRLAFFFLSRQIWFAALVSSVVRLWYSRSFLCQLRRSSGLRSSFRYKNAQISYFSSNKFGYFRNFLYLCTLFHFTRICVK